MNIVLRNLLRYPPCEGSKERHEAWKESVRILLKDDAPELDKELTKPGWVPISLAAKAQAYVFGKLLRENLPPSLDD